MQILYLLPSIVAVIGFGGVMLAPGYLVVRLFRMPGIAANNGAQRLLWSVVLSSPIALMLAVVCGPLLGNGGTAALFGLLDLWAAGLWLRSHRPTDRLHTGRQVHRTFAQLRARSCAWLCAGVAAFLLVAGAPVRVGSRLWEPIASGDWSVRVPLIASAMRNGFPPINPFYGVDGQIFPLHYYYYWYSLCGVVGSALHLPARAVIAGGSVWAAWLMFAVLFLLLDTLFRPAAGDRQFGWGRLCAGACLAMPILNFDILEVVYRFVTVHELYPEPEWWRAPSALAPSFQTMFLYAPHHTFGICACLVGYLLLTLAQEAAAEHRLSRAGIVAGGVLAGVCFATVLGTSTYVAVCFSIVGALFVVERAWAKDWQTLQTVGVAVVVAGLLSIGFVRLMLQPQPGAVHQPLLVVQLRSWMQLKSWFLLQPQLVRLPRLVQYAARALLYAALEISEAGFLLLVYIYRARRDARLGRQLSQRSRMQWMLALGFLIAAMWLSSAPANDIGFHAAFVLRIVGVLWSAPLLAQAVWNPQWRHSVLRSWQGQVAVAFIVLGLCSQAWQVVMQRFGLPIAEHTPVIAGPFPSAPAIGERSLAVLEANQAIDRLLPTSARLLTSPWSPQRSMGMLYLTRQTIAPEPGCMAAFGGNPAMCIRNLPSLGDLFGEPLTRTQQQLVFYVGQPSPVRGFGPVCRQQHATAVLVSAEDAVWQQPHSWVWSQTPVYSSPRERLFLCPTQS